MNIFSSNFRLIMSAGFAMFSMFFGSGNLVYPLIVGSFSVKNYLFAIFGFVITGVCIPFLGLLALIMYEGSKKNFFSPLGHYGQFILITFLLAFIGPLGVIPRCITVAYGGIAVIAPFFKELYFNLFFCGILIYLVWQRNRVVDIIAFFLTPFKFGSVVFIITAGLYFYKDSFDTITPHKFDVFCSGIFEGYQTLDLIASFFFSCTIYNYLKTKKGEDCSSKQIFRLSLLSSLLGGFLLAMVYVGFIILGAYYSSIIKNVAPPSMFSVIAHHIFGSSGLFIISVTLFFSCLATATILTDLSSSFLRNDICKQKITHHQSVFIVMLATFVVSLLGFQSIRSMMGEILVWLYPIFIAYTVWQIFRKVISNLS